MESTTCEDGDAHLLLGSALLYEEFKDICFVKKKSPKKLKFNFLKGLYFIGCQNFKF